MSNLPGYDPLGQAYSGIISMNGHPGAPPARVVVPIIDAGSGLWLFSGDSGGDNRARPDRQRLTRHAPACSKPASPGRR